MPARKVCQHYGCTGLAEMVQKQLADKGSERARFYGLSFLLPLESGSGEGHDTPQINCDHADREYQDAFDPGGARQQGQPEPKPEDKQAGTEQADEEVHQGFHALTSVVASVVSFILPSSLAV